MRKDVDASAVDLLIARIIANAPVHGARQLAAWRKPVRDIKRVLRRDYRRYLRRVLNQDQAQTLAEAASQVWPHFNRQPLAPSDKLISETAAGLRLHLKATPYVGSNGMALRGFYVERAEAALNKPLIYINSAHHELAVATTFCHEVGHHLSTHLFAPVDSGVQLYFDADYAAHMEDPPELAADIVVSLAGYPLPMARRIFSPAQLERPRITTLEDPVFGTIRNHLRERYGFDFPSALPAAQNLHYLAGMVHYAKLRWALLAEYQL